MARTEPRNRQDVTGTTLGLIVFLVGIGLLVFVFALALHLFRDTSVLTSIAAAPPGGEAVRPGEPGMSGMLLALGIKIATLFIMVLAGSLVASKGVHLYLASR